MPTPEEVFDSVRRGDQPGLERLLAADPSLADARDDKGLSLLMTALYHRRPALAELIRQARAEGCDVHEAAALGDVDRVGDVLDSDPEAALAWSADGFQPLHLAAYFGRGEAASLLVGRGADVGAAARNPSQVRPLHSAVAGGHVQVVELLLEAGADPEARQHGGFTPLMGAAAGGHGEIAFRLLQRGADREAKSDDGRTARQMAEERGFRELARTLA